MWNPFKTKRTYHRKTNIKRERERDVDCSGKDKKRLECNVQQPLRPIIPYFGGKTKVANKIISKFPKDYDTFVEPFVGGGSVFWKETKAKKYVINDKNKEVYNLYKTAKNSPGVVKSCKLNPSKNKFNRIRDKSNHSSCDTMVLFKHSFGADGKAFANHHGLRNNTFTDKHVNKLKKTKVLNRDFKSVVKNNDRPDVIQYLDPPYIVGGDTYKVHGVTPKEVCDSVRKLKKAKAIISYDNHPEVKKQCKGLKISSISFKYSDPKNGGISNKLKKELLITNY